MYDAQGNRLSASQEAVQSHFIIGQDAAGRWLVIETHQLGGGVFRSRADAVHYAAFESGHRPTAYEFATSPVELGF